jgi:Transposase
MDGAFLDWALEAFSGYVAADELYEGPYGVLSAVANRQYKRILYKVLDHDPTHDDITAFLGRLKGALDARDLALKGITTDGSALYPEPIRAVFGEVPHQLCTFHVIAELVKGVLRAVASERERLAKSKPTLKRGRPAAQDKAARRLARKSTSIQQKIRALFQERFVFVKRRLKPSEHKRFMHITRGLPHLRTLREIIEHIYALFDRRCHTQTALGKLKKLRQWVKRFTWIGDTLKKVFSPHLEQALTFLADKLLPATSNAVERGNRRHRKMQKSVYRVRSKVCLEGRIALDMLRESRAEGRDQTTQALHQARRGCT